jgi:hypothetical protein
MSRTRSATNSSVSNIRDFLTQDMNAKKSNDLKQDLKQALHLLRLENVGELEERFLSTDAFLKPWSIFRDSVLLLSSEAMLRSTAVNTSANPDSGISRLEILWFYTQFDEGALRYDSRADKCSLDYTPDSDVYGVIDKSAWRIEEYEKHLYVWLLQNFKVGKSYSPWRFEYFEFKNICTAWAEVFVPIINAVRASYDVKGRRYYGRLALYIEAQCPSRLAFPDSNIAMSEGDIVSPTPYRIVSKPKSTLKYDGTQIPATREKTHVVLAKKHYDETEKELRDVYPQYGGLVERPKFKHKMEEWLAEQRARANLRKVIEKHDKVQSFQPILVKREGSRSPVKNMARTPQGSLHRTKLSAGGRDGSQSPIKKGADSIRHSFSSHGSPHKEQQKNIPHGATRPLQFPDRTSSLLDESLRDSSLPRPEMQIRPSEQKVYTSIRNSNPFIEELPAELKVQRVRADTNDSTISPMGQLSAIPMPLYPESNRQGDADELEKLPDVRRKKSYHDVRMPSYEGTGYQAEISLTDLHNIRTRDFCTLNPKRGMKPSRLPTPITSVPYAGHLRVVAAPTSIPKPVAPASSLVGAVPKPAIAPLNSIALTSKPVASALKLVARAHAETAVPQPVAWPGDSPTKRSFRGDMDSDSDDSAPIVPSKSLEYKGCLHAAKSRSELLKKQDGAHDLSRIVSRENIRAALGGISRESSTERLAPPLPLAEPVRSLSSQKSLQTFNTHLFPRRDERKGTPVGGWIAADKTRFESGGSYEMELLRYEKEDDGME